jgi:hypothetical protein
MASRARKRDVDDTTTGVVEAALADERAAKLSRKKMHDAKSEFGLDQPTASAGEADEIRKLVGPNDPSISQETIAKAVKQRALLRTENAARSRSHLQVFMNVQFHTFHLLSLTKRNPLPETLYSA